MEGVEVWRGVADGCYQQGGSGHILNKSKDSQCLSEQRAGMEWERSILSILSTLMMKSTTC